MLCPSRMSAMDRASSGGRKQSRSEFLSECALHTVEWILTPEALIRRRPATIRPDRGDVEYRGRDVAVPIVFAPRLGKVSFK